MASHPLFSRPWWKEAGVEHMVMTSIGWLAMLLKPVAMGLFDKGKDRLVDEAIKHFSPGEALFESIVVPIVGILEGAEVFPPSREWISEGIEKKEDIYLSLPSHGPYSQDNAELFWRNLYVAVEDGFGTKRVPKEIHKVESKKKGEVSTKEVYSEDYPPRDVYNWCLAFWGHRGPDRLKSDMNKAHQASLAHRVKKRAGRVANQATTGLRGFLSGIREGWDQERNK